jgi:hypothetical protein
MTEEYIVEEPAPLEPRYSGFWPLLILLAALVMWSGFQAFLAIRQSTALNSEFDSAVPTIKAAQDAQSKLYAIAQDLLKISAKDPYAAQLVKEAHIQMKPNSGAAPDNTSLATPPSPADTTK